MVSFKSVLILYLVSSCWLVSTSKNPAPSVSWRTLNPCHLSSTMTGLLDTGMGFHGTAGRILKMVIGIRHIIDTTQWDVGDIINRKGDFKKNAYSSWPVCVSICKCQLEGWREPMCSPCWNSRKHQCSSYTWYNQPKESNISSYSILSRTFEWHRYGFPATSMVRQHLIRTAPGFRRRGAAWAPWTWPQYLWQYSCEMDWNGTSMVP